MTEKQTKFKETEIGMIPEDWTVSPIGNVCSVRRGASPRPIHNFISESGMPWVKISDASAQNTRFIEWTGEFIKQEGVKNSVTVHPGDLIVSNSATPGIPRFMKIDACIHDGWLLIENFKESTKEFLYYTFLNERSKLVGIADGTVFRNLKTDIVRDHKIALPEVKEQRAIASILSSLDDKIELNQRMNKTLEEIGQAIFKHWFVDFEFPNEEGKPYKSSGGEMVYNEELGKEIPKGWRVGFLGDLIHEKRVKIGDRNAQVLSAIKTGELVHSEDFFMKQVFSKNINKYLEVCMFDFAYNPARINIGSIGMLKENILGAVSPAYVVFSCRSKSHYFIEQMLKLSSIKKQIIQFCSGTVRQILEFEGISKIKLIIPNENLFIKYNEVYEGMLFQKDFLNSEIQTLSQIRDALLPKLMSGKIRVPLEGENG